MEKNKIVKEFEDILKDIEETYNRNKKDKGETWKTMEIKILYRKWLEEVKEFKARPISYEEIKDVTLVSLMLAKRLKEVKPNSSQS